MKIFVTGGHGMLGRALCERLKENIIYPTRKELNLEDDKKVLSFMLENKPDIVFHLVFARKFWKDLTGQSDRDTGGRPGLWSRYQ